MEGRGGEMLRSPLVFINAATSMASMIVTLVERLITLLITETYRHPSGAPGRGSARKRLRACLGGAGTSASRMAEGTSPQMSNGPYFW